MSEPPVPEPTKTLLGRVVGAKAERKLRSQGQSQTVWFGLGMMGLIGWSVVIPTLLGVAVGLWLDRKHGGAFSWTLALLAAGLAMGCLNAWYWVSEQDREMGEDRGDDHP
jgi:ATP synthase protein I